MTAEVTIKCQGCSYKDFDALRSVREVAVRKRDGRWSDHREVLRGVDVATIDVGHARALVTHAALALGVCGAHGAITRETRATAIDAGFRAILHHVAAGRRSAQIHGIAIRAQAIPVHRAGLTVGAIGAGWATAIEASLCAILDHIRAGRRCAGHHGIAIRARAIRVGHATLTIHTQAAHCAAAIDVRLVAILVHVHTRRRRALHHGIAITARAVAIQPAIEPVHAVVHARTTAIGIGFRSIGKTVIASRCGAHVCHGIAESALAITITRTHLPIRAIERTWTTAIDVRFHSVFLCIGASRRRARHARANLARAIRADHALLAVDTSAARTTAIDVRLHAILNRVTARGQLTNIGLTNAGHTIRGNVAFDARAGSIADLAGTLHTRESQHLRRICRHPGGARIFCARLVVSDRVRVVVHRRNGTIPITYGFLAIARRLRGRGCIRRDVCLDACSLHAVDRDAFICRRRTLACHHAYGAAARATHSTHSAHSATAGTSLPTAAAARRRRGRRGRRGRRTCLAPPADLATINAGYEFAARC